MNERDFADLAVGHALNALSEADERAYQEALAGNPNWDHHVRHAVDAVAAIGDSVEPVEPPPSVRASLFARISDLPQESAASASSAGPVDDVEDFAAAGPAVTEPEREAVTVGASPGSGWGARRWFALAASFAAVLVLGFGAVTVSQLFAPPAAVVALQQIEDAPDAQSASATMPDGTVATAHWSPSSGKSVLVADGMPAPPDGKTYELWFVRGEDQIAIPAGIFEPDADGKATAQLSGEMHSGDVIAVTVEPAGGSPDGTPSSAPVLAVATA